MAVNRDGPKINGNGVANVNSRCSGTIFRIYMVNSQRGILILIIVLVAMSIPRGVAQTNPQLTLALVGQSTAKYVIPAGQTTTLKMEILNSARPDVYLLQGEAYLDPDLNGTWELAHSEGLGNFHLAYLQSAIWTFELTVPANIRAANVTNDTPQVNLLIKIIYQAASEPQHEEQGVFALGVPGAMVQQPNGVIWYALAGLLIVVCLVAAYLVTKRRRKQ